MDIKFSILTPWLPPRETIHRSIKCIDDQTYPNWEHLISIDRKGYSLDIPSDERRKVLPCEVEHNTWGNTCRYNLWAHATGDWILYLDDDDLLYNDVLQEIHDAIIDRGEDKDWGYFAIKLYENKFFHYPVGGVGQITGGQIFHRKYALDGTEQRWENSNEYCADFNTISKNFLQKGKEPILIDKILGQLPKHGTGKL